jgi:hypothetical protein
MRIAAVGGDLPFACHVQAAVSFLVMLGLSSSTTWPVGVAALSFSAGARELNNLTFD